MATRVGIKTASNKSDPHPNPPLFKGRERAADADPPHAIALPCGGGNVVARLCANAASVDPTMKALYRYLPLVLLAVFWEVAARLELVSSSALPPLSDVIVSWIDLLKGGELWGNTAASLY